MSDAIKVNHISFGSSAETAEAHGLVYCKLEHRDLEAYHCRTCGVDCPIGHYYFGRSTILKVRSTVTFCKTCVEGGEFTLWLLSQ